MSHEQALKDLRFTAAILGALFTLMGLQDFNKQNYVGAAIGLLAGFFQITMSVRAHVAIKDIKNDNSK